MKRSDFIYRAVIQRTPRAQPHSQELGIPGAQMLLREAEALAAAVGAQYPFEGEVPAQAPPRQPQAYPQGGAGRPQQMQPVPQPQPQPQPHPQPYYEPHYEPQHPSAQQGAPILSESAQPAPPPPQAYVPPPPPVQQQQQPRPVARAPQAAQGQSILAGAVAAGTPCTVCGVQLTMDHKCAPRPGQPTNTVPIPEH